MYLPPQGFHPGAQEVRLVFAKMVVMLKVKAVSYHCSKNKNRLSGYSGDNVRVDLKIRTY